MTEEERLTLKELLPAEDQSEDAVMHLLTYSPQFSQTKSVWQDMLATGEFDPDFAEIIQMRRAMQATTRGSRYAARNLGGDAEDQWAAMNEAMKSGAASCLTRDAHKSGMATDSKEGEDPHIGKFMVQGSMEDVEEDDEEAAGLPSSGQNTLSSGLPSSGELESVDDEGETAPAPGDHDGSSEVPSKGVQENGSEVPPKAIKDFPRKGIKFPFHGVKDDPFGERLEGEEEGEAQGEEMGSLGEASHAPVYPGGSSVQAIMSGVTVPPPDEEVYNSQAEEGQAGPTCGQPRPLASGTGVGKEDSMIAPVATTSLHVPEPGKGSSGWDMTEVDEPESVPKRSSLGKTPGGAFGAFGKPTIGGGAFSKTRGSAPPQNGFKSLSTMNADGNGQHSVGAFSKRNSTPPNESENSSILEPDSAEPDSAEPDSALLGEPGS